MYCYQCGKKLVEGAKFCHICGADQKVLEDLLVSDSKDSGQKNEPSFPSKNENSPFSSLKEDQYDLNHYIEKVDTQVKKNLEEFEAKEEIIAAQKNEVSLGPKVQEAKKKKRSFKQIWKDFINEEDNPYSVFGTIEEKKILPSSQNDNQETPKAQSTNTTKFVPLNKTLPLEEESVPGDNKGGFENTLEAKKTQEDVFIQDLKVQEVLSKDTEPKEEPTPQVFRETTETKETLKSGDKGSSLWRKPLLKAKNKIHPLSIKGNKSGGETSKKNVSSNNGDTQENPLSSDLLDNSKTRNIFHGASKKYHKILAWVHKKPKESLIGIFVLGIIFSLSPIFIIQKSVGLAEVVFSIFKLFIGLFTFYYANYIARRNTFSGPIKAALNIDTLIQWALCQFLLFIAFFLYPKNIVMGHDLLGSLTPHFISSVFLYIIAAFLSIVSVASRIKPSQYLEYAGWFSIVFILIELFSKLFWVLVTFLSTSIL